jgi:hypothetical protein
VHDIITSHEMLQKTQAVRALQEGCSRLGLPSSTAVALLQFLSVKRTHDQFVPENDRQLRMSPGATLDKLWHYMLLNTTGTLMVRAALPYVCGLVGCGCFQQLCRRLLLLPLLLQLPPAAWSSSCLHQRGASVPILKVQS